MENYLEATFGREHRQEAARRDNPFQTLEQFDVKIARREQEATETRLRIAQDEIDRRDGFTFVQTVIKRLVR
jgi:peptide deformylase